MGSPGREILEKASAGDFDAVLRRGHAGGVTAGSVCSGRPAAEEKLLLLTRVVLSGEKAAGGTDRKCTRAGFQGLAHSYCTCSNPLSPSLRG